jgi:hypothetical protein
MSTSDEIQQILETMLQAATTTAAQQWGTIETTVTQELQILAHRVSQIAEGLAAGDMTQDDAGDFFAVVRNHAVEDIAMATTLVRSAAQQIVDAALAAAQTAINKLVGFTLV